MSLSPSIHEWAAFAADLQQAGIFGRAFNGDRFTLGWDSGMEAVTMLTLLEGDVRWGVHQTHLGRQDPPVDRWRPARIGQFWDWWRQHSPTTSQFALQHLIAGLHPAARGFTTVPPSPELAGQLRRIGRTSIDLGGGVLIEDNDPVVLVGKIWHLSEGRHESLYLLRCALPSLDSGRSTEEGRSAESWQLLTVGRVENDLEGSASGVYEMSVGIGRDHDGRFEEQMPPAAAAA